MGLRGPSDIGTGWCDALTSPDHNGVCWWRRNNVKASSQHARWKSILAPPGQASCKAQSSSQPLCICVFTYSLRAGLRTSLRNRWTLSPEKTHKNTNLPPLTLPLSGCVIRLLLESDPVVMGEIKVSGKGKVDFHTQHHSKPWYFKAWEIIAMTQFRNVKARQRYFHRLSHLFTLFSPLFRLCLFPLQIYEVII